jgi:basic membrane protein A and related proteins
MRKRKFGFAMSFVLAASTILGACGASDEQENAGTDNGGETPAETVDFKAGLVTDTGGVDDKSFNQSAWEGLVKFGEERGLTEGEGYRYLQSGAESEYIPNLTQFAENGFDLTIAAGFLLEDPVQTTAEQIPDAQFVLIDSLLSDENWNTVWLDNVANVTFKEHQGSFLVGVAAALHTKTNKVGFVGGVDSPLIKKFESGFKAGVKAVNPDIEIVAQYVEDFNDAAKASTIASSMYEQQIDIIYHAAGGSGNGVFTEAKNRKNNGQDVWVIGVDRDQHEEGMPENVTLTSMVKRVDVAVYEMAQQTLAGDFPGGKETVFGIEEGAVGIAPTTSNLTEDTINKIKEYEQQILSGEIEVPQTDEEYAEYEGSL